MRITLRAALSAALLFLAAAPLPAEVVRFEIERREPFAEGESFGDVGPYEIIAGRVFYAVEPSLPQNEPIVDLKLAPRNESGRVEFSADLFILAPVDPAKGNGALIYDVNNRGNKLALRFFNESPGGNNPKSPGNGFLMRRGYTILWSGWIGELLEGDNRLRLAAPLAREGDQKITGMVRYEMAIDSDTNRVPASGANHGAYRPTEKGLREATLTWRLRPGDPRVPIPRDQFTIHVGEAPEGELPLIELEVPAGLARGYLYELIYEAEDPLVQGVSFAAVRDLVAALKHGEGEGNPLAPDGKPAISLAYGFGVSQSGRFLREFLYTGMNDDEHGRMAFDGLMPHVAGGGLGSFNHRFAQPTAYVTQREHHDWHTDRFPFSYELQRDPLSDKEDSLLRRAEASDHVPRVIQSQSSTEYWSRSGSLVHTDPLGERDAVLPDNVRFFAFGGTQHGPSGFPPSAGPGQTLANPADYRPQLRALLVALDRWCRDDEPPPPSVYPTLAAGTLVDFRQQATGFPAIPHVRYPEVIQQPDLLDLGPRWESERIIDRQPPLALKSYKVLVPRCGDDGNELGCLLPLEVAVPLATYTGWSLRNREVGAENDLVGLNGSYIPFATTREKRDATGDPRLSIQERYGTLGAYRERLETTCRSYVESGYLLEEDVAPLIERLTNQAKPLFDEIGGTQ